METQKPLPGFDLSVTETIHAMSMEEKVERAIMLLQLHAPDDGYYLAFSGGKDSCAIKRLAEIAKVPFEAFYNNTTIDPPELVRFIKKQHADVKWNNPEMPMMARVVERSNGPPTRLSRWCCEEYKEKGGDGKVKIFGVRQAESKARARRWSEIAQATTSGLAVCPIVYWTDDHVWEFLRGYNVPYCELYDQGWSRLGCVGCPLNPTSQEKEFDRDNWKKAVIANWERYKDEPRKDGNPRYQSKFKTAEDFWQWWLSAKAPSYFHGDCQSMFLWTNEDVSDL